MGRGRGKGKKLAANHEDAGSGEEEKIPAQKRRGRPQKPLKDEFDEEEIEKLEEDNENKYPVKVGNGSLVAENGKKRKRNSPAKEIPSPIKDENGAHTKLNNDEPVKPNGFRHIGSRRKGKPHRAAEVGVECN
ncbi:hypothetical protein Droror1_Dr00001567 [Drosera rotundifolia]